MISLDFQHDKIVIKRVMAEKETVTPLAANNVLREG